MRLNAPDCMAVGDVSHELLFPRVAAVVHHGGAGTIAAVARAGILHLVTQMFSDHFYWASHIVHLGIGAMSPHGTMTGECLIRALREVCGPAMAARARAFAGQAVRDEANIAARQLENELNQLQHVRSRKPETDPDESLIVRMLD